LSVTADEKWPVASAARFTAPCPANSESPANAPESNVTVPGTHLRIVTTRAVVGALSR
jgi:hypothetical protein